MSRALRSLYVDLNSFFASCEQQLRPELRNKPIAVVPMIADSTAVIAASYEAKAFGVKTNVRVGDAKKMCPNLILVPATHGRYVVFHHKIIEAIDKVLPIAAVCSIDEIACELTGSQQNPEKATKLALEIKKVMAQDVGEFMKCSIGVAPNFLVAKIACDMQKPDGLTIIEDHELPHRLFELKLQDIPGIGRRMNERLNNQGIHTMIDLLSSNEQKMRGLWGNVHGARLHLLLNGGWIDLRKETPPKSIGHQHVLPPKDRSYEGVLTVAHKLLWKAAVRLRAKKMMARKLSFSVRYLDGHRLYEEVRFDGTQDSSFLLKQINRLYKKAPEKKKPIKASIVLSDFVSEYEHQLSLFNNNGRAHKAFKAVDAINARYGKNTIYVASLHDKIDSAPTRIAFQRIPGLDEVDEELKD
jgi:DNA polymerase IV